MKNRICSLCSGCGGLDLGFIEAGFNVIWANDLDNMP
jgi:DNA (cytosine-5)-methyltransferase 1